MASLGSPQTSRYMIGAFEVRVAPMTEAGRMTQGHSIGVVENFAFNGNQQTVDLLAGFPRKPVDTAVTQTVSSVSFGFREYSRRNLSMLLGAGVPDYESANSSTSSELTANTGNTAYAENATVLKISAFAGSPTNLLTDDCSATTGWDLTDPNGADSAVWTHDAVNDWFKFTGLSSEEIPWGGNPLKRALSGLNTAKAYRVQVTVVERTQGTCRVYLETGKETYSVPANPSFNGNMGGNKTYEFTFWSNGATSDNLVFQPSWNFDGAITSVVVDADSGQTWAVGDLVTLFDSANPAAVSVHKVTAYNGGTNTLTVAPGIPFGIAAADAPRFRLFRPAAISIGSGDQGVQYFSVSLVQTERSSGRPIVMDIWKATIASGAQFSGAVTDFSTANVELKVLKPAASDYADGGPLEHLKKVIPSWPTLRYATVRD